MLAWPTALSHSEERGAQFIKLALYILWDEPQLTVLWAGREKEALETSPAPQLCQEGKTDK